LIKKGHKVTVISGYYSKKKPKEILYKYSHREIEIIWVPLLSILYKRYPQLKGSLPPNLSSMTYLKRMDYDKYDVIHLQGFGHLLIDFVNLVATNPRKILTIHGFPKYIEQNGGAGYSLKLLYKMYCETLGKHTLNSINVITAVSKFVAEECVKKGIPRNKINVIPNGINLKKYRPVYVYDELKEKFNIKNDDILVLSIARITWNKGFEYALEAIHRVMKATEKSIKYIIIGPIENKIYYSKLKEQIERLGLINNVIFTGFIPLYSSLKFQALSRANIFLAPSLHESFGLVILEAMALGKPIIASNCEGIKCLLKHMKTGILVKPANSEDITNAILFLLINPDIQINLSKGAVSACIEYDLKNVVNTYEELYNKI